MLRFGIVYNKGIYSLETTYNLILCAKKNSLRRSNSIESKANYEISNMFLFKVGFQSTVKLIKVNEM